MNDLEKLLFLRGVASEYFSYAGERIEVPYELRVKYLQAMGYDLNDAEAIRQAIFELDAKPWQAWLPPFNILAQGESEYIDMRLAPGDLDSEINWCVTTEYGESRSGHVVAAALQEVGDYIIDTVRYSARRLPLDGLPCGYHRLTLASSQHQDSATLVVAPAQCYTGIVAPASATPVSTVPVAHENKRGLLGISCQLYTLRSARNWGIGDFTDLQELVVCSAAQGIDFIGLNPLHAPNFAGVDFASPYSPSDRRFLNPLYIDVERVPEYRSSGSIAKLVKSSGFRRKLQALRALESIDYQGVVALKYWAFEELYRVFARQHLAKNSARAEAFAQFVEQAGVSLQHFAEHEARFGIATIKAAKEPAFHQYLQWLASQQLDQCQQNALASGMRIGLMGDLAVGASNGGAEVSSKPALFCLHASTGAPPDPFSSEGQDWSLPPLDPVELARDNFQHYIELLRANMAHCGALRIDHVMGMLRLWWCLPEQRGGAYIYYPMQTLLALLRLESHRNRCLVVGEDMGVVPDEVREAMAGSAIYSNKLFYFERDAEQQFRQPADYASAALLMVTNHDVPTLAGWWNGSELALRAQVGLLDTQTELPQRLEELRCDKHRLLAWLQMQALLPASWQQQGFDQLLEKPFDLDLCGAILRACSGSQAQLVSFQLEDLQLIEAPVNMPGSFSEYANWRRKQTRETSAIFDDAAITALLQPVYEARDH